MMSITIGHITFDHATYDAVGDVLYLHVGEPSPAADAVETPQGHVLRYGPSGDIIGLTLVSPKWLLEHDETITVTLPQRVSIDPATLAPALSPAA